MMESNRLGPGGRSAGSAEASPELSVQVGTQVWWVTNRPCGGHSSGPLRGHVRCGGEPPRVHGMAGGAPPTSAHDGRAWPAHKTSGRCRQ